MSAEDTGDYGDGLHRLSVADYHAMIRAGVFEDGEPFEMLEGLLIDKPRQTPLRAAVISMLCRAFARELPAGWCLRGPAPVTTGDSEPEPDLTIAPGDHRDYFRRHPHAAEAALVVEVADAGIGRARGWKQRVYARGEAGEYWILDLLGRRLEVYRDPTGPDVGEPYYRSRTIYEVDADVPLPLPGVAPLKLTAILPAA